MNNLKFISLTLGIATTILPFINAQALPMYEDDGKRVVTPLNIFNMENKNLKRNQKEEMSEILVKLYNNYNTLLKRGLEINDIKNSDLYINITNQKINLKELLNNIISYPYTIVNSEIEKNFLESKFSFCYLTKEYIKDENLTRIFNATDITDIKQDLNNVLNSITLSIDIIKTFRGEYNNTYLNDITMCLNSLINNNIYNIDSFNEHKDTIQNLINEVSSSINDILIEYI